MNAKQKSDHTLETVLGVLGGLGIAGGAGYVAHRYGSLLGNLIPNPPKSNYFMIPENYFKDDPALEFLRMAEKASGLPADKIPEHILKYEYDKWMLERVD